MATHEAGFVDQMQRRVIELSYGEMVRDERHGGYGDTSGLPSLAPEPERGAAAVAALTAVLEVQREAALAAAAGLDPTVVDADDDDMTDAAALAAAPRTSAPEPRVAPERPTPEPADPAEAVEPVPPAPAESVPASGSEGERTPAPPQAEASVPPPSSHTQPIPVADLAEIDVAELGLADRLGLGETDPDDEVGPTS
jgi:cell division transport system ATP-binding protein